jgi:hypothetical protein
VKNMRLELLLAIFLVLIGSFVVMLEPKFVVSAQNDTIGVAVNVTNVTSIDIVQTNITFNGAPGTVITPAETGDTIEVRNVGSNNVTNIFVYINTAARETSNPLGGSNSSYNAGGYIVIRNSSLADANYSFVGRLEWNLSTGQTAAPSGFTPPSKNNVSWGWFRNVTRFYLWNVSATTNCTYDGRISVEDAADDGTTNTRAPHIENSSTPTVYNHATLGNWSIYPFNGWPGQPYCVAVHTSCTKIYIYRWDEGSEYFPSCTSALYLRPSAAGRDNDIAPGFSALFSVRAFVPYGAPAGNHTAALMTISSTAA